ncbi:PREDICTED: protein FAR1-RELATED SEQUENCE 5-like [Ipomoea nil]|uniref:protein FAR1-RELATED SEQUENCE 5-like n=1 Tax=Ipomoea nil TaxID=35883 RepID=UPI000901A2DB|nr:PREDICTED: protein FAR1-RELATED SEQUENCE 5-like [Ipomoea nil]
MELRIIVTDQDPAMKVVIPRVFKQARQRYCMWHIMCKVGENVGLTLSKNEEFKNKLNSIVWTSSLKPADFETQWTQLMEKFNLVDHNWFTHIFEARNRWIPAYFRDVFMGGLLRTTSRSESENYTYSHFTSLQSSLVEFMMNFDSALNSQSHTNAKNNSDNEGYNPDMKTPVLSVRGDAGILHYEIMDGRDRIFSVVHNVNEQEATCNCKMFEMVGLLCRHIFVVFKDLEKIPLKYVVNRWTKDASLKATFEIDGVIYDQNGPKDEKKVLLNKLWVDIHCCIDLANSNMEQLAAFLQHSRKTVIESFCGSTEISEINILPLKHAKNKGSGKRIKSSKELAMEKEEGRRRRST